MNTIRNSSRKHRWAAASLTAVLAGGAWVGALAPAQAQLSVPELPVDTTPLAPVVDTVTDTVNDTVSDTAQTVNDGIDTVNQVIDDVTGQLPDLPIEIPDVDLPHVPTLPGLPGLPGLSGADGAAGTSPTSGGSTGGKAPTGGDSRSPSSTSPSGGGRSGGARRTVGAWSNGSRLMSTAEIVALMEEVGASDEALARVLSPFPAAGLAEYRDDGSSRSSVDLDLTGIVPVTAVQSGFVTSVVPGNDGEFAIGMTDIDGHDVTYRGVDLGSFPVVAGQSVERGDVLGSADETLGFDFGEGALEFLADALETGQAEARLYAMGIRVARAMFGDRAFDMVPAASVSLAPIPRSLSMLAAALLTVVALGLGWVAHAAPAPATARRRTLMAAGARA